MNSSKYCVLGLVAAALLLFGVGFAAADMATGNFWATLDGAGNLVGAGGDGYPDPDPSDGSDEGQWYYYTDGDWWNQWWYNHPFDPERRKIVKVTFNYDATDASGWAEVTVNWSDPTWSDPDPGAPPLPADQDHVLRLSDPEYDGAAWFVEGDDVFETDYFILPVLYNPEWVSIDIRGEYMEITGTIEHDCIVPLPAAVWLLGSGLIGLVVVRRRMSQKAATGTAVGHCAKILN
ncbi:MAG: VPLPA-CTERM sorting domain-containing protein [Thermodesulfobacteriota bacterium]|nr:VPLPA-CTERM sorting domain-containing protein [Thermodesulfobacteriota bacterium]